MGARVRPRLASLPAAIASLALLGGCSLLKPSADTTRYYVLTALSPGASAESSLPSSSQLLSIGLGPVVLPGYLDRSELVARLAPNELHVADNDRWGEPLVEGFRRILRQDLCVLLGTDRVVQYPFHAKSPPALVLTVDVSHFEPIGTEARVKLVARWSLRAGDGRVLAGDETTVLEPITDGEGRGAEVAAMSRALGRLAGTLVSAVPSALSTL